MNRTLRAVIACLLVAVIVCSAVSILMNLGRRIRVDITDQNLYTLSDGTYAIIDKLNQPIRLTLYYSRTASMDGPDQIQFFNTYFQYVNNLLGQYAAVSHNMIDYQLIDPRPYTDAEEQAVRFGLQLFPLDNEGQEKFVFGLVLETPFGVTKTIPFFSPDRQNFIEYDITSLIDAAITREKKRLGVLSSIQVIGDDENPYIVEMMVRQGMQPRESWPLIVQLRQNYDVVEVATTVEEISDVDILLIIHPQDLARQTLFAIDQFVLRGGRTIILTDPHCFAAQQQQQPQQQGMPPESPSSQINILLNAWGLNMPDQTFAGDQNLAISQAFSQGQQPLPVIGFLQLRDDCINSDYIATSELDNIVLLFSGVLERANQQQTVDLEYTPLLQTTKEGNSWQTRSPYELMQIASISPRILMSYFTPGTEPATMAYLVTGRLDSAFPEGLELASADAMALPDPCELHQPTRRTGLAQAEQDCAVAVFADVDFVSELLAYDFNPYLRTYTVTGENSTLLLNTIESITGSSELIGLRSRGSFTRPFIIVDEIEKQAELKYAQQVESLREQINGYSQQLNQLLASNDQNDQMLIESSILKRRQDLQKQLDQANEQLRLISLAKRENIAALGNRLRMINIVLVPAIVFVFAIGLAIYRLWRHKRTAKR